MLKNFYFSVFIIVTFLSTQVFSQNLYRSNPSGFGGSGNWSTASNWEVSTNGGTTWAAASVAPNTSTDIVTIQANHSLTLDTNPTVKDLIIESNAELHNSSSTLYGIFIYGNLSVSGVLGGSGDNIALAFDRNDGGTSTVSGSGAIDLQYIAKFSNSASTVSITNATVNLYKSGNAVYNSSAGNTLTLNMSGGTLNLKNGTLGSTDMSYSFSGGTVNYSTSGSQSVFGTTYNNLTLSGSGTKTLSANTNINGVLSLSGTASFDRNSNTLTYGSSSSLKYAGSTSQLTTVQEFTSGVKNLTIANTNGVTLDASRSISGNFTINSATNFNDNGKTLTIGGNFANSGTHSGSGKILLSGATSAISGSGVFQNIEVSGTNTSNSGTGTFNGTFTHSGGTFTNTGTMTFADGMTIIRSSGNSSDFVNSGTFTYSGTIDLNYSGTVTTGAEVPSSSSVLNNVQNNGVVTLGGNMIVNGVLTLNSNFNIGANILTIYNAIAGTATNLISTSSSTVKIGGTSSNVNLPSSIIALGGFVIDNPNGTTLAADLTVSNLLTCTTGNINTGSHTLTWSGAAGSLTESAGNYIVGTVATTRTVASSSSENFGGIGLTFSSGADAFSCLVTRYSGSSAAVNVGANTGINRKWEITPAADYSGDRNLTLSWLQDDDNGKTLTAMRIYSLAPAASDWVDESGSDQDGTSRVLTKVSLGAITSGTKMTYTISATNSPLPVELTSFTAEAANIGVLLKWTTATEVNNYGFEIQRASSSTTPRQDGWKKIGFVGGHGNSNSPKIYSFQDNNAVSGKYSYRLKQIDVDGAFEYSDVVNVSANLPDKFELMQNYPNPFNPVTTISYAISSSVKVNLTVYDMLGREVENLINEEKEPGKYSIRFDAGKLSSGVYIYTLRAGKFVANKKLILMK